MSQRTPSLKWWKQLNGRVDEYFSGLSAKELRDDIAEHKEINKFLRNEVNRLGMDVYHQTGGLHVTHAHTAPSAQTNRQLRPSADELFLYGGAPVEKRSSVLGFLLLDVEEDSKSGKWFAGRYSASTSGKVILLEPKWVFRDQAAAWRECRRQRVLETCKLALLNFTDCRTIPAVPISCRPITPEDVVLARNAWLRWRKQLVPLVYDYCECLVNVESKEQYERGVASIPEVWRFEMAHRRWIDASMLPKPPSVDFLPESFFRPKTLHRITESFILQGELIKGWIRMGYCFLPEVLLTHFLNLKLGTNLSLKAIEKMRLRLGFKSMHYARPSPRIFELKKKTCTRSRKKPVILA